MPAAWSSGAVKRCERPSDDFRRRISLQPRSAGVPAADAAVEADHIDRIVDDGVDEQLEIGGFQITIFFFFATCPHIQSLWT